MSRATERNMGWAGWACVLVGAACSGCGYQVRLLCDPVINAGVHENGSPLDVDVVCLGAKEFEAFPEIKSFTSKQWFEGKRKGSLRVDRDRVYSLAYQESEFGKTVGKPLRNGEERAVHVTHAQPFNSGSQIYVFGKFDRKEGGIEETAPVRHTDVTWRRREFTVRVQKQGLYEEKSP